MTDEKQAAVPQVALVTGGSRGIGRAVAQGLATAGWQVYFCSRSRESVAAAEAELAAAGLAERVSGRCCDMRSEEQVNALVAEVLAQAGRIDCLVNNAGLGIFGPVDELTGEQWRQVLETNLSGVFYALRAVAPAMRRQGSGWIFNIASLAGRHAFAGGAAYNASKFGLLGLTEAAMLDLRAAGVRVAAILPGSVDTDFHAGRQDDHSWMLAPEDVAQVVLDLLRYPARALPSLVEIRPARTRGQ